MHKVLRTLIISDLFIVGSFGLIQPIFAVFLLQGVYGASVSAIGIALAMQLLTKSLFQILIGKWDDEEKGNRRELYTLLCGSILIAFVPFGYALSTSMLHIYALQIIMGLGGALSYPSWRIMFTRYVHQEKEGYEWSVYDTIISLATAVTAAIGGYIAQMYSFRFLFVFVGMLSLVGALFIVTIFKKEFTRLPTWGAMIEETKKKRTSVRKKKAIKSLRIKKA